MPTSALISPNGGLYMAGTTGGLRYGPLNGNSASSTSVGINTGSNAQASITGITIVNGQLWAASPSGTVRLGMIGNGLPTIAGQTTTALPGFSTTGINGGNAIEFALFDLSPSVASLDTLYVVDGTGIAKYSLVANNWTYNGTITSSISNLTGLAASRSGNNVVLVASGPTGLVTHTDTTGSNGNVTGRITTTLALRSFDGATPLGLTNVILRGLEWVPDETAVVPISGLVSPLDYVVGNTGLLAIAPSARFADQSNFQGGSLRVAITDEVAGDAVDLLVGSGINLSGSTLLFNGIEIGTITVALRVLQPI